VSKALRCIHIDM